MTELADRIKKSHDAFTHSGKFHADDVFSSALLRMINPDINITRVNSVDENTQGIIFDIGKGEFDHHQTDSRIRENGVPYAAFGLLWEGVGADILGEESAEKFDEKFIQPLDESDNTGIKNAIADLINDFNPGWESDSNGDREFFDAVEFAGKILKNRIDNILASNRAYEILEEKLKENQDNDILVLERSLPWRKKLIPTDIKFVVHPSNRGGYCSIAVPAEEGSLELKCPFCEEWRGKDTEELRKISGIKTLNFCHKSGFMVSADTKEDVIKACRISLERMKNTEAE